MGINHPCQCNMRNNTQTAMTNWAIIPWKVDTLTEPQEIRSGGRLHDYCKWNGFALVNEGGLLAIFFFTYKELVYYIKGKTQFVYSSSVPYS